VVEVQVESRNCAAPDADDDGLWIVGSNVQPVSHPNTWHALASWSAGKWARITGSHPPQPPLDGRGDGCGGGGGTVVGGGCVVVVGGTVVVVVVGGTVEVVEVVALGGSAGTSA
jgi:hypothetical protein